MYDNRAYMYPNSLHINWQIVLYRDAWQLDLWSCYHTQWYTKLMRQYSTAVFSPIRRVISTTGTKSAEKLVFWSCLAVGLFYPADVIM